LNIRLGFARLGRVTAISYGLVSLLIVGSVGKDQWEERELEVHPQTFTVREPNGRVYLVPAQDEWEASSAVEDYIKSNVDLSDLFADIPTTAGAQNPVRISVAKYDHPRTIAEVAKSAGMAAMWCALVYTILWAVFRGVRWVALGFMDGKVAKPSD
jgi:hypothetical protein